MTRARAPDQGAQTNAPPPCQVPFRLTRDVVDGMGAFGVEGPMRRCCEETLRVGKALLGGVAGLPGVSIVVLQCAWM